MGPTPFADGRFRIAFLLGALALGAGILAWRSSFPASTPTADRRPPTASSSPPTADRLPPTVDGYRAAIRGALAPFLGIRATLPEEYGDARAAAEASPARVAKEAALGVVVPGAEIQAHLALILALGKIEQGAGAREGNVWESGEKALDAWLTAHEWATE